MNIKVIQGILIPFLGTSLGAAMVFFLKEQIDRVIRSVNSGRYVFIERMDVKTIPVEDERSFRTR